MLLRFSEILKDAGEYTEKILQNFVEVRDEIKWWIEQEFEK